MPQAWPKILIRQGFAFPARRPAGPARAAGRPAQAPAMVISAMRSVGASLP
jgi:hypothetical protein